ncbi:uncharacterized protein BO96DRAFT_431570 [Aspergillus niger CBS 101883]|uniref:uncharacterized protein n=1 Tax=Aspergillus lacticoffeatus (strain CBS 101883) TaxID=1450533 RepID=UPI000D7FCC86|nr:uncharacterized protein BO96DRAFT_431570 [Aspergillus niger CBS 101883]PYH59421.1 hypothetical protein BO96DRAFT_431570 [Aspergillus niger CBS 101883]
MVDTIAEKVIFCRLAVKVCADRITREVESPDLLGSQRYIVLAYLAQIADLTESTYDTQTTSLFNDFGSLDYLYEGRLFLPNCLLSIFTIVPLCGGCNVLMKWAVRLRVRQAATISGALGTTAPPNPRIMSADRTMSGMGDAACVRRCQVVSCWRERPGSLPNMSHDQGIRGYLPGTNRSSESVRQFKPDYERPRPIEGGECELAWETARGSQDGDGLAMETISSDGPELGVQAVLKVSGIMLAKIPFHCLVLGLSTSFGLFQPPPHSVDIICATVSSRQEAWVWSGHTGVP